MAAMASAAPMSPLENRLKIASGSVWVFPWRLPANRIVAPNSPRARAHARAAPAERPWPAIGTATRKNVSVLPAPSVRDTPSNRPSMEAKAATACLV